MSFEHQNSMNMAKQEYNGLRKLFKEKIAGEHARSVMDVVYSELEDQKWCMARDEVERIIVRAIDEWDGENG